MICNHVIRRKDRNVTTVLPGMSVIKYYKWLNNRSLNKGNNKITELRTILQRESQNS
jgi:hypothetical protein